jgi:hypothetical protein
MMPPTHIHRVLLIIPAAERPKFVQAWAHYDPGHIAETWNKPLYPDGDTTGPPSHYWISVGWTQEDLDYLDTALVEIAGGSDPPALAAAGITRVLDDNTGAWTDPSTVLADLGLWVRPPPEVAGLPGG